MNRKRSPHHLPFLVSAFALAIFAIGSIALADNKPLTPVSTGRQKNLNFDGDYVETMGKNLDSLTALRESQKGRDSHLYRKRAEFAPETAENLRESRFEQ
jgi:hypothetical protein